mmetsp:Transcript_122773/g.393236  ORF Transcript_122773/g.393236 Transcript_122773/m.393236 type:complete len:278 (-) Transcript_122773:1819-2652(-)
MKRVDNHLETILSHSAFRVQIALVVQTNVRANRINPHYACTVMSHHSRNDYQATNVRVSTQYCVRPMLPWHTHLKCTTHAPGRLTKAASTKVLIEEHGIDGKQQQTKQPRAASSTVRYKSSLAQCWRTSSPSNAGAPQRHVDSPSSQDPKVRERFESASNTSPSGVAARFLPAVTSTLSAATAAFCANSSASSALSPGAVQQRQIGAATSSFPPSPVRKVNAIVSPKSSIHVSITPSLMWAATPCTETTSGHSISAMVLEIALLILPRNLANVPGRS